MPGRDGIFCLRDLSWVRVGAIWIAPPLCTEWGDLVCWGPPQSTKKIIDAALPWLCPLLEGLDTRPLAAIGCLGKDEGGGGGWEIVHMLKSKSDGTYYVLV